MPQEIQTVSLKVPCYLVKTGCGFILIDTGDSSDCALLEKALARAGVKPGELTLVLLTHGDFDHAGNAAFLQEKYGAKVAMHREDAEMVQRSDQGWGRKAQPDRVTIFGRMIIFLSSYAVKPGPFQRFTPDLFVEDGSKLSEYGLDAEVVHLPGHSKGSIGIFTASGDLFCGDLLMNMLHPGLHFMIDDLADCQASLDRLKMLNLKTIYPGHGAPFSAEKLMLIKA
jgi:glyoxylase-like metal-dependent hydrolase (beta-lactamase superfamily II)